MSTLHMVRIAIDIRALAQFAIAERADDDDRGYATHLALRRRFGAAAPQPFRLFESGAAGPFLLGYASDVPALLDAAALPPIDERLDAVFPSQPTSRAMPSSWRAGARFSFEVRARPVVRYGPRARAARAAEGKRVAAERDAFLAAVEKAGTGPVDREAVYLDWLVQQVEGAAWIERSAIIAMRRLSTHRSTHGQAGRRQIEGYDACFAGTLAVEAPEAFKHLLSHGIGRHAAFGFGMLALSPARPV